MIKTRTLWLGLILLISLLCLFLGAYKYRPSLSHFLPPHPVKMTIHLQQYLAAQKTDFKRDLLQGKLDNWVVVAGNAAGDLDSAASALALAHIGDILRLHGKRWLALFQQPRDALELRQENTWAFAQAGLAMSDMLLPNDFASIGSTTKYPTTVNWAIVDLNKLDVRDFGRDPTVLTLFDHHEDEGLYQRAFPRIVRVPTGSCASLIVNHFSQDIDRIPSGILTLLLSAMLIDTQNFQPSGKATDTDRRALEILLPPLARANLFLSASALESHFQHLRTLKYDVSTLNMWDLLRRDSKTFEASHPRITKIGLATIPLSLEHLVKEFGSGNIIQALTRWMTQGRDALGLVGILTSYRTSDGKSARQILILLREDSEIPSRFLEVSQDILKLKPLNTHFTELIEIADNSSMTVGIWQQGNAKATRKQSAPALLKTLAELNPIELNSISNL